MKKTKIMTTEKVYDFNVDGDEIGIVKDLLILKGLS